MTINNLRRQVSSMFVEVQMEDAQSLSRYLICDALNMSSSEMFVHDMDEVDDAMVGQIVEMAMRIVDGEPLQYVTGKAYFHDNEFYVAPGVLIPRPETSELVDLIVSDSPKGKILDVGTGSGCIAISLKKSLPHCQVSALDVSQDALKIADKNAHVLGAEVSFINADILNLGDSIGQYDVVVSNPPYICDKEKSAMLANVLDYEPHLALFVPDEDPLLFYRAIAKRCRQEMLVEGGSLYFEINEVYPEETCEMLRREGFSDVMAFKDMYEKWRMVKATLKTR